MSVILQLDLEGLRIKEAGRGTDTVYEVVSRLVEDLELQCSPS